MVERQVIGSIARRYLRDCRTAADVETEKLFYSTLILTLYQTIELRLQISSAFPILWAILQKMQTNFYDLLKFTAEVTQQSMARVYQNKHQGILILHLSQNKNPYSFMNSMPFHPTFQRNTNASLML